MQFSSVLKHSIRLSLLLAAAFCIGAQDQPAPPKAEGIPPRAAPTDYQTHAQAGKLSLAAEFTGHSIMMADATLTSEDYVVIETAVYGEPGARMKLSHEDFALRINGKKQPLTSQPYGIVVKTLKNPQLEPTASETKSKTSVNTGGGGGGDNTPAPPYRVPDELRHSWGQQLQKLALPEGDRALPQGGLIFFPYRGKTDKIQSLELTYTGPTGPITVELQ